MSKIYVFGIGGTGARVIRSLTMLLASGVKLGENIDTVIPVIIDQDRSNGDLTRTIALLKTYKSLHDQLKFGRNSKSEFFKTNIDDLNTSFRMQVADVADKDFQSYIKYLNLDTRNKALVSLLFSKKNLEARMDVGFKGNPNMGSVVLNNFSTEADNDLGSILESFQSGDKIFIISSIFGGTGAAGFPLLLKTLRQAQSSQLPSAALVANAPIGAITVLPYFGVQHDEDSEINMDSFMSKAKAALSYYRDNLNTDVLYYISDKLSKNYDNHEGDSAQRNNAHFVEMVAALSIIDFCKNNVQHDGSKSFKEFGFNEDKPVVSIRTLADSTRALVGKPLISMFIFEKFYKEHLKNTWENAWAKDFSYADDDNEGKMDSTVMSHDFFVKLTKFLKDFDNEWLREMANNSRAFKPFNLETSGENIFNSIDGYEPKKTGFWGKLTSKNLDGYEAIDNAIADISNDLHKKLPMYDYFMDVHWQAINKVLKSKFGI
ncbi:hypothetical protein HMPREF0673_02265 [Leyella stercorea DSM 18206]|uniref:Uncharacterized protein n=1 Tax=Leyella stercorea DSM 18206 TaxID=1002367 RepID=G6B048_9BACT|nr:hypothetical protein [Leyella stercorea]EHJ37956.1 hypothetical protein HMPREF0673_02265 [Leyella stercorea DSM 18206]